MHEKHVTPDPDPDSEDEPGDKNNATKQEDMSANESGESDTDPLPYFDVSTTGACERLATLTLADTPAPSHRDSQASSTSNIDATAKLTKFRPVCESIDTLRVLLDARADPNTIITPGQLSPLRNVICFAHQKDVASMRDLLLKYGAAESDDDKKRWKQRELADLNELAWLKNFHKDDRA